VGDENTAGPTRQIGAGALFELVIERGFAGIELVQNVVIGQQNRRGQSHLLLPDGQVLQALSQSLVRLWGRIEECDKSCVGFLVYRNDRAIKQGVLCGETGRVEDKIGSVFAG
jgi:hypothetical protein